MWVWIVKYNFVNVYCENMFVENCELQKRTCVKLARELSL